MVPGVLDFWQHVHLHAGVIAGSTFPLGDSIHIAVHRPQAECSPLAPGHGLSVHSDGPGRRSLLCCVPHDPFASILCW
ncbi:hypothetical protein D3C79_946210 [compost metagenome]